MTKIKANDSDPTFVSAVFHGITRVTTKKYITKNDNQQQLIKKTRYQANSHICNNSTTAYVFVYTVQCNAH